MGYIAPMSFPPRVASLLTFSLMISACGGAEPVRPRSLAPSPTPARATRPVVDDEPPVGRLPEDVTPTHYNLAIQILPQRESFTGMAIIQATLEARRQRIWLHGRGLEVSSATVRTEAGVEHEATWEEVPGEGGLASLSLERPVEPGPVTISISYRGTFGAQLRGLYRVEDGDDAYAFTQFEPTAARQAFPSFDEPRFKTPFDVTLIVAEDDVAAANTPVAEEVATRAGLRRVRFETSRPMPTYLVAFAVGPLDVVEVSPIPANAHRTTPLPLRGLAARGRGDRLAYALEHTGEILANLEEYFGSPYPYAKLDIVAVPDFASGAMENVGLVTFRESLLLLGDGTQVPDWQPRAYANVMAHELAHMWFGNLVTMPWWDDLWLNEAFATWMAAKVVQDIFPQYRAELIQLESTHRAMGTDARVSARQIRQPIESGHDIPNAFDSITYRKGAAVLNMVESWIGEDAFRDGLRLYMRRHAWGNAVAADLLSALDEAAGRDVSSVFQSFLYQSGVPFIDASLSCEGDVATVGIRQSRFLPVGSTGDRAQSWTMPICLRFGRGEQVSRQCEVISEPEATIRLAGEGCPAWVMPNADGAGYLRFSLSTEGLASLREAGWERLSDAERVAVADSLRAGMQNASVSVGDFFGAAPALANDALRQVSQIPMGPIGFARTRLVMQEERGAVEAWARSVYEATYRRLGWRPRPGVQEDGLTRTHRASVLRFMVGTARDRGARRQATRRGLAYLGYPRGGELDHEAVDPNQAGMVTRIAVQEGDARLWEYVLERTLEEEDSVVRGHLLSALSSSHDPGLAARARALVLDERLRVNEASRPMWTQMSMEETREATWAWVQENFDAIVARVGSRGASYLPYLGSNFCTEADAAAVEAFFGPRVESLPGAPRNLASALESIRLCAARVDAHREGARAFFQAH